MPWKVEKRGDEFAVVSKESGKVEGTHDTRRMLAPLGCSGSSRCFLSSPSEGLLILRCY